MGDPGGELFFIPARASSAGWIVLGAALVSHLVAEPEFKGSVAISFPTCEILCGTHEIELSWHFLGFFSLLAVEKGDKSCEKLLCSLSKT